MRGIYTAYTVVRDALPVAVAVLYARKRSGNTACLASIRSSRDWEIEVFPSRGPTALDPRSHRKHIHVLLTSDVEKERERSEMCTCASQIEGDSRKNFYTCFFSKDDIQVSIIVGAIN